MDIVRDLQEPIVALPNPVVLLRLMECIAFVAFDDILSVLRSGCMYSKGADEKAGLGLAA